MANNSAQQQALKDLQSQVEWLEKERRLTSRKLAELEQRFELHGREIAGRERRIQDLEKQLASTNAQLVRINQIDNQLAQFKDDLVQLIEQYDQRRLKAEEELDRLRRVEHETVVRELADIRKELPAIGRLEQDMALRQAEEARLSNLIGVLKNQLSAFDNQVETWAREFSFVSEKEKQNQRNVAEVQTSQLELSKRWESFNEQLTLVRSEIVRANSDVRGLQEAHEKATVNLNSWLEQVQLGEHQRNRQLENWRGVLEEQQNIIERFQKEWIPMADQYKEAKMAVDTLIGWQQQIEQQQQQVAEQLRLESGRIQTRWDNFVQEMDKRWKNADLDAEQRWAAVNRHEKELREQLLLLEEQLTRFEQDRELLWRIQTAQADAIKKIPRLWLEEVEKAIQQDPNRRRQPALVTVREE